ncbi:hypothetical protein [Bradyrhizobium sp. CCGUVB23]|uniref:hypothetical protein n=1 Tax=Bradyrhizobium sp. CCGUVB23 TaxID=2949630 RepID=UPI0020B1FE3E|nr:hypothetical protein [Bradyrhizobium sp. CCGUVB23]MCP3466418.1 hypothetical protein [Bradyrhizobium sp. CCGUVB23]
MTVVVIPFTVVETSLTMVLAELPLPPPAPPLPPADWDDDAVAEDEVVADVDDVAEEEELAAD